MPRSGWEGTGLRERESAGRGAALLRTEGVTRWAQDRIAQPDLTEWT
ncbi:hypothetical protein BKA15_003970 [Microlunatus parietis]|uniref:Uncharacterized protein n=1 Tax=Microlunatus parietis TaxID=682979 RepID=A0A7Y9I966_9ACTN|nr:hypothetical protein [Microlunatus parietis]